MDKDDESVFEEDDLDQLDALSNGVVELIHEGRLEEAQAAGRELLRRFPQVMDGHLRLAMVYEALEENERAAEHYRRAASFEDNAEALRLDFLRKADQLAPPQ